MSGQQCCLPLDSHILIKAIYARPPLWNKNHVSHKDSEVIEGLWNEVSVEVNSPSKSDIVTIIRFCFQFYYVS